MDENQREIVLTPESIQAIAREVAGMLVNQPEQLNRLADKVSERFDINIDYKRIQNEVIDRISGQESKSGGTGDNYTLTDQDRMDIAQQALSGLDLVEEVKNALVGAFVSKSFFNKNIGALKKFIEQNKGKAATAGISGGEMVQEINRALGTDEWQGGGVGGSGDMLKSVYDTNDDGKVNEADAADSVPWTGVTGKPAIGDMVKSVYDTNNDGKVDAGAFDDSGLAHLAGVETFTGAKTFPDGTQGITQSPGDNSLNFATTAYADAAGGSGDVVGPASAIDTQIVVFDEATGKIIQTVPVTINPATRKVTLMGVTEQDDEQYIVENKGVTWTNDGKSTGITKRGRIYVSGVGNIIWFEILEVQIALIKGTAATGGFQILATTQSTSINTGALKNSGGWSCIGNGHNGGSLYQHAAQFSKRTASATDYNPSILTKDYIIAITDTSVPRAVTISNEDIAAGAAGMVRRFVIKDKSGNAGTNNIIISGESGNIDDGASLAINTDYGKMRLYSDGTNLWTE